MHLPLWKMSAAVIPGILAIVTAFVTIWIGERFYVVVTCGVASMVIAVTGALLLNTRRLLATVPSPLLALAVVASIALTHWPLRTAHWFSESSLDAIAERIRSGHPLDGPERAGAFLIEKAEISPKGIVCLWTHLADGGNTGFVQTSPDHLPFNLWSTVPLNAHWQFIAED